MTLTQILQYLDYFYVAVFATAVASFGAFLWCLGYIVLLHGRFREYRKYAEVELKKYIREHEKYKQQAGEMQVYLEGRLDELRGYYEQGWTSKPEE